MEWVRQALVDLEPGRVKAGEEGEAGITLTMFWKAASGHKGELGMETRGI